eukprot:Sdes_comp20561_c0_seq1m15411
MLPHVDDVEVGADRGRGSKLAFIAGVIPREKVASFERVLWRACHGNVFMRSSVIEHTLCEPLSGEQVWKNVFVIFYQGETLQNKVKKICEAFGASTYPCPETMMERRELSKQVMTRIEDLQSVLTKTSEHRRRILQTASTSLPVWRVQVLKMKACYHTLNMFNIDVTHKCLIAEAWCPINALNDIQMALARAAERAGSSVPSILNRMATHASPPTFHRTNKFTVGFQNIVDAYGVATYREANPGLFAIITFPFLFAVMFGDFGHGLLMTLFALFLLLKEKSLINYRGGGEMFDTVFGGRYIIFLMGIFSMYTGLIYNDTFSKPMNLFGTSWALPAAANGTVHLSPSQDFSGTPYLIGIDPLWNVADNKLTFSNSFKMKTAVILGVLQMTFGIILSFTNHRYFKRPLNIYCEFIPQLIFLLAIFGYLSLLILYKWAADWYQVGRFPSLLLTLINMFLSFGTVKPEDRLFRGQAFLQNSLVLLALVCVPWMLFTKPFLLQRKHSMKKSARLQRRRSRSISVSSLSSDTGLLFSATDPPPPRTLTTPQSLTLPILWSTNASTPSSSAWAPSQTQPPISACGRSLSPTPNCPMFYGPWFSIPASTAPIPSFSSFPSSSGPFSPSSSSSSWKACPLFCTRSVFIGSSLTASFTVEPAICLPPLVSILSSMSLYKIIHP